MRGRPQAEAEARVQRGLHVDVASRKLTAGSTADVEMLHRTSSLLSRSVECRPPAVALKRGHGSVANGGAALDLTCYRRCACCTRGAGPVRHVELHTRAQECRRHLDRQRKQRRFSTMALARPMTAVVVMAVTVVGVVVVGGGVSSGILAKPQPLKGVNKKQHVS
jgi:hypothetical protein